jgi:hypothetical protein
MTSSDLPWPSAAALLSILLVVVAAVVFAQEQPAGKPQWIRFHSQDSKDCQFSVVFPGKPTIAKDSSKQSEAVVFPMWTYTFTGKRGAYRLSCTISPPELSSRGRESALLLGSRDMALKLTDGKLSEDRAVTVSEFPGRTFTLNFTANNTKFVSYIEIVLTERTLYQLQVTIPTDYMTVDKATDVDYFVNSFSITAR